MAVNDREALTCADESVGDTLTEIGGGVMIVIVAVLALLVSATDCAVSITVAGLGTVPGAV